jgi:hypothetical protein
MPNNYILALKEFNKDKPKWSVPKKDSPDYAKVMKIKAKLDNQKGKGAIFSTQNQVSPYSKAELKERKQYIDNIIDYRRANIIVSGNKQYRLDNKLTRGKLNKLSTQQLKDKSTKGDFLFQDEKGLKIQKAEGEIPRNRAVRQERLSLNIKNEFKPLLDQIKERRTMLNNEIVDLERQIRNQGANRNPNDLIDHSRIRLYRRVFRQIKQDVNDLINTFEDRDDYKARAIINDKEFEDLKDEIKEAINEVEEQVNNELEQIEIDNPYVEEEDNEPELIRADIELDT